ncbi:hypothetical protein [Altericista sp. CCNU0014]|uniref:hypothetical protein n=1 Tax=Altericista sp. CCNU0014 TaxID=3082949 RepID=UPI00384E08F9
MNIKATLARLGCTMADTRAARDLLLLPGPDRVESSQAAEASDTINIVVGYSGSQNSQAALDLTLLIAYQTRLATRKRVVVQTVYVLEGIYHPQKPLLSTAVGNAISAQRDLEWGTATATVSERRTDKSALARRHTVNCVDVRAAQLQCFEEADRVLWQARTFATEWRGSLNTHLRFGSPAIELSKVAQQEEASIAIVGCHSSEHDLVRQMKDICSCPVLGIPTKKFEH